jgi:luciferase family oxidoreductase group 1
VDAVRNTLDLARHCDELGYTRYWLAEHHNSTLIASSAPEIMIGHVASATKRIRVGSGGVMLPNHSPLKVAENFKVLEALHAGRIDLGIGRAPGTDQLTALALRRARSAMSADDFPEQLSELMAFLTGNFSADHPFRRIRAVPEVATKPELWLLGSSDFSARLAAELGVGFAFAHHINNWPAVEVCKLYRKLFRPSIYFTEPQVMLSVAAVCAETDAEAEQIAISFDWTLLKLVQGIQNYFPSVEEMRNYPFNQEERRIIQFNREKLFVGAAARVSEQLSKLAKQAEVNEIMILSMTHDHEARRRSYSLLAEAFSL